MLQSLFYLTTVLHVSGVIVTHLQEQKTTVTTASGNHYTVMDRVKFTDKEHILHFPQKYIINNNFNFNLIFLYSLSVNLTISITV
jgi:hypothetical protein